MYRKITASARKQKVRKLILTAFATFLTDLTEHLFLPNLTSVGLDKGNRSD